MIITALPPVALTDVSRQGDTAGVFTHIYEPDCQLAVWRRPLSEALTGYVDGLERHYHAINLRELLPADVVTDTLCARLP